ncbi:MAG TPA: hypothetical protein VKG23_11550 [Thermoanaerobaculia bacterium]|nr:hypothetical protein [Thermoanaerobaculia bacterium]
MRQETRPNGSFARSHRALAALLAVGAAIVVSAAAIAIHRRSEDRRHGWSSRAAWIWYARAGKKPAPLRFWAERDLALERVPERVEARFLVDPEFALFVNGRRVASGSCRPGDALRVVDLARDLRPGRNRIVIEASSPDGVGGILFLAEGPGLDPAAFDSGPDWRVARDPAELERGEGRPAIVWGRPPQYPWGYPRLPAR